MQNFTESLRYEFPGLSPSSLVLDVGAYEGNWGRIVAEKYSCAVHFFEPIKQFHDAILLRLINHPNRSDMVIHPFGLGATTGRTVMRVKGDSSGVHADGPEEEVGIVGIDDLLDNSEFSGRQIDVMKLNCEGGEFPILETLIELDLAHRIDVLHVQPHTCVPNHEARWEKIMAGMSKTHRVIFNAPWCWVGFKLKGFA